MKNQRMKTKAGSMAYAKLAVVVLMIAALICSFTVLVAAATATPAVDPETDLSFEGFQKDASGVLYKVYDGANKTDVKVTFKNNKDQLGNGVTLTATAKLNDATVAGAKFITVSFKLNGDAEAIKNVETPRDITVAAYVQPKKLTWATGTATASTTFKPGTASYTAKVENVPALQGAITGDKVDPTVPTATVNGVTAAGKAETTVNVASSNANYVIEPLKVSFDVKKVTIVKIDWKSDYTFQWGDKAIDEVKVVGYDANNVAYQMVLEFPKGYGNVGTYEITAKTPDEKNIELGDVTAKMAVKINKKVIEVSMPDVSYIGNKDVQADPTEFMLVVNGDVPADIRALIKYTVDGADFDGTSEYGAYTVKAVLPSSGNYEFKGTDGKVVTELEGTMYINKQFVAGGTADAPYQIILLGENGFSKDVAVKVSIPESLSRKALRGFKLHAKYTLELTGAEGETFTVLIPISDAMLHKNAGALTANDLYIYEGATGTIAAASKAYTVTINQGYYEVSGVSGNGSVTFVIAPEYNAPWYITAWGIALIIFLILALFVLLILLGFYLRRAKKDEEETVTVDEGEVAEAAPAEIEETVDEEAYLEETADTIAEELADTEAPAEEADTEGTEEAVEEALNELTAEAEELAEEETTVPEELAEAVAEEIEESYNESADAEDAIPLESDDEAAPAIAIVEDTDDDDDDDDDDEEESYRGFGSMPLTFIDAIEEAEQYAAWLEQEARGEVQLVTRYRRSFQSRLIQSQGNIQDYYNILKNALLSYKGVKNRVSWNYEAYNRGRIHVAKMNAKTKTLYLYLALDPEELKDTKYGIVDVSSKKKYASVPVLMKIKGERKFKYALELIEKLCGENLQLQKLDLPEVDYRIPYQTTEELVQAGVVKKMVACIPVAALEAEPSEEAPVAEASASAQTQEVTFVAPTDVPAVEAAAEEVAADAEATTNDEPTEI